VKVVVVVQARTGSTRLPGKVMLPLGGRTVLGRMLERVCAAITPDEIVVATTTLVADDAIVEVARRAGVRVVRGHATELLDRHLQAARAAAADLVVKIPSDCPLIDPVVIDRVIAAFDEHAHDYVSNLHPASFPDGNDVEVMSRDALAIAAREAVRPLEREHTTPFLWDQPYRFRCGNVRWETGRDASTTHRLTLDHPEDYALIRAVFDALWTPQRPLFTLDEIVELLDERPELRALNAVHLGSAWYHDHPGELHTLAEVQP
jgi:spore coat polysaccharide biosynthesis protein SpsF